MIKYTFVMSCSAALFYMQEKIDPFIIVAIKAHQI